MVAAVLAALAVGGCGSSASHPAATPIGGFAWLRPAAPPPGWHAVTIPQGATLFYPPSWRQTHGDRGTATAVSLGAGGRIAGYLNLTPRQGVESRRGWSRFRVEHNGDEGDLGVRQQASASQLRFRGGRGSCVRDAYATRTGAHYVELACLVDGRHGSSVIVAAAPPALWSRYGTLLQQALDGFEP